MTLFRAVLLFLLGVFIGILITLVTRPARADVLLIVNGVTVGPIQQYVKLEPRSPDWVDYCKQRPPPSLILGRCSGSEVESIAETCERAMKEIGAAQLVAGQPVLCIPAPSGLKR